MLFEFAASERIIFGNGALSQAGEIASELGKKTLIVKGSGSVPVDGLLTVLGQAGISSDIFEVGHEPDIAMIQEGLSAAQSAESEMVIGFGGGSVLDSAKAISAMMTNPGNLMDYLEVIGGGKKIPNRAAPMIALPTTAGTGTEVTRNAVIASPKHHVKVSMRSPKMIPMVAIVDPELTYTMPPSVTASTGMDALTQVIEGYVSIRANPMTDVVSKEGIKRGSRSLLAAYKDGENKQAREDMALTSLFGGLSLANGGLGAVHGFAGPVGGMFEAPHGAICASLLPYVMKYNVKTLASFEGLQAVFYRYHEIAKWITGNPTASIDDGVNWIIKLANELEIPGLRNIGIEEKDFEQIIEKSIVSSSMQKNPVKLDRKTMRLILEEAY